MLKGVDIASYQKKDYPGYDFVIVKATEGRTYINPKWKDQTENAIKNGQLLGLYHYCRPENNRPEDEAKFFVDVIWPYRGKAVLAADWEQVALNYSPEWLLRFMQEVERLTGVKPLLYIQQSAISNGQYDIIAEAGYKLWMAQYNSYMSSHHGAWTEVTVWQYTSTGGALDKDNFYGSREDWLAMASPEDSENGEFVTKLIVGNTKKGMTGATVRGLQALLNAHGYGPLKEDGIFGDQTMRSVIRFQEKEHLAADGIVGPKTWNRLVGLS